MSDCLHPTLAAIADKFRTKMLLLDRNDNILYANAEWTEYACHLGLSRFFQWNGVDYMDFMKELVLDQAHLNRLGKALQSIWSGERFAYSEDFPAPPSLAAEASLKIEAFPLLDLGASSSLPECVAVSHRFTDSRILPLSSPAPRRKVVARFPKRYIPVCASCRSVRNNQEVWVSSEAFFKASLGIEFTHDICPSCVRMLYPQYAKSFENSRV